MPSSALAPIDRLRFLWERARGFDVRSVTGRARKTARIHGKKYPVVLVDMLWSAGVKRVGFNDYIEFDFAILNRAERATWVTSPLALELSKTFDDPAFVHHFHHKIDSSTDSSVASGWTWRRRVRMNSASSRSVILS